MSTTLVSLLAAAIALLGACIAWGQWYTARQKLALDLFERRMSAYVTFRQSLAQLAVEGPQSYEQTLAIDKAAYEMRFLFSSITIEKIREVSNAAFQYHTDDLRFQRACKSYAREEKNIAYLEEKVGFSADQFHRSQLTLDLLMEPYLRMDQKLPRSPFEWTGMFIEWVRHRHANRPDGTK